MISNASEAPAAPRPPTRTVRVFVTFFVGLAALVLISTLGAPTCACTAAPTSEPPASPVVGIVVGVDSTGLGRVAGFTVRIADGSTIEFELGFLENPTEFPPSHIAEHLASSQPVRVSFIAESSRLVVYRLEDATATPT